MTRSLARLSLRCVPFSTFEDEVATAAGSSRAARATQVRYLKTYLADGDICARRIVVESPYVDRHYLEEFAGYYAANLQAPSNKTTRLHFFRGEHDADLLDRAIDLAAAVGPDEASRTLQDDYLGFVVVRPLPAAPIGRTVLAQYRGDPQRIYEPAQSEHRVHLAGLTLRVQALPFQQQDQAVGACATTALWSALSRAVRADGGRAPTPLAVTRAATQFAVTGRGLPAADGLDLNQMLAAVRAFGYSPLALKPGGPATQAAFISSVVTYLRSGIPVILRVNGAGQGHALTLSGYREHPTEHQVIEVSSLRTLRTMKPVRFYAHDDRLGPYARLRIVAEQDKYEALRVKFEPRAPGFEEFEEPAIVEHAIVPLYPKLRLTAEDLTAFACQYEPMMGAVAGEFRDELSVEMRFALAGDYLRDIHALGLGQGRAAAIVKTCELSRYVGVLRFRIKDAPLADILLDTTDIRRPGEDSHVIAIARLWAGVDILADAASRFGVGDRVL